MYKFLFKKRAKLKELTLLKKTARKFFVKVVAIARKKVY